MIMIEATHLTESICEMVKEFFRQFLKSLAILEKPYLLYG